MLFNSFGFIFLYLPVVLLGFFLLARVRHSFAASWLVIASLFFYGYWNPFYISLLLGSIICNFAFGLWIAKAKDKLYLLTLAIIANISLLAYYKYSNFFIL